ncbi:aspartate dehydrogenase domain-containing protein [Fusobacterium sp. PH5-44]|uniref:aspartate dehydrogenase domain-containing protein n=1 Tax=unclassified Fusobacterium TaxID=2648384 RepID=UPI003D225828
MLKLALLGCGYLNEIVANALKDGHLPDYELVGVLGRNMDKTKSFASTHNCKACGSIEELLALNPDCVAEAASGQAIRDYGEIILKGNADLIVLSIGAFADTDFYEKIKEIAKKHKQKIYIASGAVGGFDVLKTAALMSPIETTFKSLKMPRALYNGPLYKDGLLDIKEPENVFRGTTREAIEMMPQHFNVAVATALSSAGIEKTVMEIDAVPNFVGDQYLIELQGEEVYAHLNIYSRTSKIAAWSVVRVLQNIAGPVVF